MIVSTNVIISLEKIALKNYKIGKECTAGREELPPSQTFSTLSVKSGHI